MAGEFLNDSGTQSGAIIAMREKAREMLPGYMIPGLLGYIERGEPVGGFLTALLSNDLHGTFERADDINRACIFEYLSFLYSYAPAGCWGSKARFEQWQKQGGLTVQEKTS